MAQKQKRAILVPVVRTNEVPVIMRQLAQAFVSRAMKICILKKKLGKERRSLSNSEVNEEREE